MTPNTDDSIAAALVQFESVEAVLATKLEAVRNVIAATRALQGITDPAASVTVILPPATAEGTKAPARPHTNGKRPYVRKVTGNLRSPRPMNNRTLAVLRTLAQRADGYVDIEEVRARMPRIAGETDAQHRTATRNTLARLQTAGLARSGDRRGQWMATAQGRTAAGVTPKEAP